MFFDLTSARMPFAMRLTDQQKAFQLWEAIAASRATCPDTGHPSTAHVAREHTCYLAKSC